MLGHNDAMPIRVDGIRKSYGNYDVLNNLCLDVRAGEFLTLLGPSGSGKTTLLMIMAGFVRANSGSIRFGEREIIALPPHRRNIGMVFQNYALFPHLDVFENIAFPLRRRGTQEQDIRRRVNDALALVQLSEFGHRRVQQLSGGQRQRVALARAIVFEPPIILMDEPLAALDKSLREHMQIELRALHKRLGTTTVYVTHDQREGITMSDRIAIMDQGNIVQIDDPKTIYNTPNSRFVAEFIGDSNVLAISNDNGVVRLCDEPLAIASHKTTPPKPVLIARPEHIQISANTVDRSNNSRLAKLEDIVFQGESVICYARLADGQLVRARQVAQAGFVLDMPVGSNVSLIFDPSACVLVPQGGAS